MITLNKITNHVSGYEVYRDGILIGIVRPHSIRYWRIFDSNWKLLGERLRTRKSAIAELDRMITSRPDLEP